MPQATDSQIAMWRGAIALAWTDGKLDEGEKARLLEYFKDNIYLSDTQRAQLVKDLDRPAQLKDVWNDITDKEDRAHLIDIAPDIFWGGGNYSPAEHEVYNKMFSDQMGTVDIQKIKEDVAEIKAQIPKEHEEYDREYVEELDKAGSWIGTVGHMIYRFDRMLGIDPIDNI